MKAIIDNLFTVPVIKYAESLITSIQFTTVNSVQALFTDLAILELCSEIGIEPVRHTPKQQVGYSFWQVAKLKVTQTDEFLRELKILVGKKMNECESQLHYPTDKIIKEMYSTYPVGLGVGVPINPWINSLLFEEQIEYFMHHLEKLLMFTLGYNARNEGGHFSLEMEGIEELLAHEKKQFFASKEIFIESILHLSSWPGYKKWEEILPKKPQLCEH